MKGVNNEGSNTDRMQAFQMSKAKAGGDSFRHEDVDLMVCTDLIDQSRTMALNGSSDHATLLEVLAANPEDKALASDADPQLLLKVFFKEKVNLSFVELRFNRPPALQEGEEDEPDMYGKPRLVKLFVNRSDMNFDDVDEFEPVAQHVVSSDEATESRFLCVGHRFQRVESLTVFIEEAADGEAKRSFINRLSIVGHQAKSYHAEYK